MANHNIRGGINWANVREGDSIYFYGADSKYTSGNQFELLIPKGIFDFRCWGANGYDALSNGGYGARVLAELNTNGTTLYGMTGTRGDKGLDISNGGGSVGETALNRCYGGGATHIATVYRGTGILADYANYQSDVLLVAGGGGGASTVSGSMFGGNGGTPNGGDGIPKKSGYAAKGGTQSSGGAGGGYSGYTGESGSFGKGGNAKKYSTQITYSGAGGGGWYGGGGGGYRNNFLSAGDGSSGGGGGSSYTRNDLTLVSYDTYNDNYGGIEFNCIKLGDYTCTQNLTNCTSDFTGVQYFWSGDSRAIALTIKSGYYTWDRAIVSVTVGGVDVTSSVYNPTTHIITLTNIAGNVVINALCYSYPTVPLNDKCSAVGTYSITATSNSNSPRYTESNKSVSTAFYSVTKPTVSGVTDWHYDASSHGPTIVNPNPAHATKSGTFSAIDAGSYVCIWTLDNNATWSDKDFNQCRINWQIVKANNNLTVSKSSVSLSVGSSTTVSLSATYSGDGFSYSGEGSVATISISGSTMTITGAAAGTITLYVWANEGTNYSRSDKIGISVTVTE